MVDTAKSKPAGTPSQEGVAQLCDPGIEIVTVAAASKEHPRHSEASVLELTDGRLMIAWIEFVGGEKSGGDDAPANIAAMTSSDGGKTWSDYRILVQREAADINVFSPNLLRLHNGDILFVYMKYHVLGDAVHPSASCYSCRSTDEGKTFSHPTPVWVQKPWTHASAVLKQLSCGRIVLPMSRQTGLVWSPSDHVVVGCTWSDDDGRSWHEPTSWVDLPQRGAMEPHVIERKDGRLLMVLRTQLGSVYKCLSEDQGVTWSEPVTTGLGAPESCPEIVRIPSTGDLLIIWNHGRYEPEREHCGKRTPLTVALSNDEGESWHHFRNIEDDPDWAYTNPGCTITDRNKVILTYWASEYHSDGRLNGDRISLKAALFDVDWLCD